jgi:hypothetical protein
MIFEEYDLKKFEKTPKREHATFHPKENMQEN